MCRKLPLTAFLRRALVSLSAMGRWEWGQVENIQEQRAEHRINALNS
jgi:hypothetical protein